jgi:polyhydroxyalkanoate synthesis regulator phasin
MARSETEGLLARLRQMSEDGLTSVFDELMSNDRARRALGRAGERLLRNKHVFDRNIESLLDFVNIPSKRDVRELKSRLDHLASQLMNLNMKLDRLLAKERPEAPRARKRDSTH